ncbi:MAG: hypothetical protein IJH07_04150 [Ruminococcus sp.]|nr:hypothetical protein [Ruminococcus sp.]
MTNTKFRKRALLSSVAMLLVALVALGSATFAWFTANPNAKASGLSMKTTASAGLVIRTETDSTWSHDAKLANGKSAFNATPVSQDQSTPGNFWTVGAAYASAYGAGTESMTGVTPGCTGDEGVFAEKVYCRLSDGSDANNNSSMKVYLKGVSISVASGATMQNAMRIAVAGPNGLLGTWALSTTGQHGQLTTATQAASSTWANADSQVTTLQSCPTSSLNIDTGLTALSADGSDLTKYITVYVYLDGQDTDCYSDKVGTVNASAIISGVQVDLTLA